jgi:DNA helicase II / ATP-dependent DNA helicase PcrA
MPLNRIVLAAAGSRKTTHLIETALASKKRILILTYTNENLNQIRKTFERRLGIVPKNVQLQSWFRFLLHHGARPYQNALYDRCRIETVIFPESSDARQTMRYIKKINASRYYFASDGAIVADRLAEFVIACDGLTRGNVFTRLAEVFDCVYIDEVQDLAGYDLEVLRELLKTSIETIAVGDHRQVIYRTSYSQKNKQYQDQNVVKFFESLAAAGLCEIELRNESYRCVQPICDFADSLFPQFPKTVSRNNIATGHDGVFVVSEEDVENYISEFQPQILRYSATANTFGQEAINFGASKGLTFDRVLIVPTKRMAEYLSTADLSKAGTLPKFYVAATRARQSVAFVLSGDCQIPNVHWYH